jgi:hypothetical protein
MHAQDAMTITQKFFASVKSLQTLSYTGDLKERVKGKMISEKDVFKININPFKIYVYQYAPKLGLECLYLTGQNGNKSKINPNTFPWVNVSLSPEGDISLADRHHSIFDAGFAYTASILEYLLKKYQTPKLMTLNGLVKMQGADCYYLTFANPSYQMTTYTTLANETSLSIAKKLHLNFYSILENNPKLNISGTIKTGTVLTVPSDYASKMELYIQKDKFYPTCMRVYDSKGLYEEYTFNDVVINTLKDIDFSADNPKYGF